MSVDLLWFTAQWCGPCKAMERAGVKTTLEAEGYEVTQIDTDAQRALANQFSISAMPTMIIRKDGVPVRKLVGARDAATLLAEMKLAEAHD